MTFWNPKYMLVAGLLAAIVFCRNRKVLPGFLMGVAFWMSIVVFSAPRDGGAVASWFEACRTSYFFDPHLLHRTFIYTSLPALSILNMPFELRDAAKAVFATPRLVWWDWLHS